MKSKRNTITFNGRLYDSETGKLLSGQPDSDSPPKQAKPAAKHHKPKDSGDGKPPTRSAHHPHDTKRPHQHSKTLMRQAVKRPLHLSHKISDLQASKPANHNIEPITELGIGTIKQNRSKHAANVHKSHLIHRFAARDEHNPIVIKHVSKLSVKAPPDEHVIKEHTSAPVLEQSSGGLFNEALAEATSHHQTLQHRNRRQRAAKKLGITTGSVHFAITVLAVMVLGGFVLYQNAANIRVRLAASDAGIHASLPSYRPSGFALDRNIQIYPGQIVLSFHSNTDSRSFKIVQATAPSGNNVTVGGIIAAAGQPYQSINQANGPTIYLYGSDNAVWVKDSTWYSIEGNSSLNSSQLLKIANSF